MTVIIKLFRIIVSASSFLYSSCILCYLMYFLSKQNESSNYISQSDAEKSLVLQTLWSMFVNTSLLCCFIMQHSLMATDAVKSIFTKLKLEDLDRSIYNAAASGALHLLMSEWQRIPWVTIWNIDSSQNNKTWLLIGVLHFFGWFIIYSGCVIMDFSELAGLKQVYYKNSGRPCPMSIKSKELKRYLKHMRHPSFFGFLIILWIHPIMSADRLLLASILSVYMIMMWSIDEIDYQYHSFVFGRKQKELNYHSS